MPFDSNQPAFVALRDIISERTSPILIWSGAGLSCPAGLPNWSGLRHFLCDKLEAKIATFPTADRSKPTALLSAARDSTDLWHAFTTLQEGLGRESFKQYVRDAIRPSDTATVPEVYELCWRLGIAGFLNLNLDRFAAKSHAMAGREDAVVLFSGKEVNNFAHLLKGPNAFVANLHGLIEDHSSWVFTKGQLNSLLASQTYNDFIKSCLYSRTIVYLGISADDTAAGGFLEAVARHADVGPHFWITDRVDASTDSWAESAGIRIIRYANDDGTHQQLRHALELLGNHVTTEEAVPLPVSPPLDTQHADALPPQDILLREDSETIRQTLNRHAATILCKDDPNKYDEYRNFCSEYDAAIYRAWHISTTEPYNTVLGYKVHGVIAQGAFGRVFRAQDKDGNPVAIKVLHENVRENAEMFQGFRRGVQSMRILEQQGVKGVVAYKAAAEIPTITVMDLIEGPNLQEAVESRHITEWTTILHVGCELSKIIHESHRLADRVLHRDIRPANVMIRNGWGSEEDWEVLVLDFDLSWHRGAVEVSVASPNALNGYLAPEQLRRTGAASTRNAGVDSFGLGMTLYFMRTIEHPQVGQPNHHDWAQSLSRHTSRFKCARWQSLPARYFRLVHHATRMNQAQRWDVSQIVGELDRLKCALEDPGRVRSAELIAEELFARSIGFPYAWDDHRLAAVNEYPTGLSVRVIGDEAKREVGIEIVWQQIGTFQYDSISKWVPGAVGQVRSLLTKDGWQLTSQSGTARICISARRTVEGFSQKMDEHAATLSRVMRALAFS